MPMSALRSGHGLLGHAAGSHAEGWTTNIPAMGKEVFSIVFQVRHWQEFQQSLGDR